MASAYEIPQFTTTASPLSELDADVLVALVSQGDTSTVELIDRATGGELSAVFQRGEMSNKAGETWTTTIADAGFKTKRLIAVNIGPDTGLATERARRAGACAALSARHQRRARIAIGVPESWTTDAVVEALVEGATLANYDNGHLKSRNESRFFLTSIHLAGLSNRSNAAVQRGARVGEAVNAARLLINEPGNHLTPREFASRSAALAAVPHVTAEVLDEKRLEELQMGLLLGVARGSAEPPRLLVLDYQPPGAPPSPVLGLIGKGITFDTGGISLKPAEGMERMKDDMAGGAAVVAALRAIALEQIPLRVVAIVPCTENMPGGRATKPGDIHRGASGITVEINNTDAEGRLILGDAIWYARQLGATHLVDVATLTGACVVALGKITTGLFATAGWSEHLVAAAERGGERIWPMPLFEEYRESLKSEIADMLNSPGRPGGAITAAMFLKEFTGGLPWAHLDIAGTAWLEESRPWMPKGATGVMTRTLVELARTAGKGWPARP